MLQGMHKKMSSLFTDMGKFLAFDPKKYSLDEMFGDIKAFIIQFKVSVGRHTFLSSMSLHNIKSFFMQFNVQFNVCTVKGHFMCAIR